MQQHQDAFLRNSSRGQDIEVVVSSLVALGVYRRHEEAGVAARHLWGVEQDVLEI